ncbi:YvcK family protein [Caloramator sp. E03]|uniref:gluconeogenesis factor YvcK family protein n=1 Tax=Caloramator sp. E03 TaxID=2576307 RepID=UPI001110455B|nr:YvcK family protein [Caloramator sp. E03]QCX34472.1 YvcK family protein [Caloramator sp. E03]
MNLFDWIRPGLRIKRWILMGFLGITIFVLGISKLLFRGPLFDSYLLLYIYIAFLGVIMMYASLKMELKSIFALINGTNINTKITKQSISDLLYEQRLLIRGPKIVAIGGGTGLSTMLRGLKEYTSNICAIVTVADDGGGSGVLRDTFGMLPPGDIRNCLVALAHTEPVMEELMQYRFKEGNLKNQSFGNLFIAAMNGISANFEEAIKKMSDVLAVTGKVYPVTLNDVTLCAKLSNDMIVQGESNIPLESIKHKSKIERVYLKPENPKPLEDALYAIDNADCIVIGPGSLYTSILPNLVIKEVAERVKKSSAIKIYVSNIMTQSGETDGYKLSDHIKAIESHCGKGMIDFVIANSGIIPEKYFKKYKEDSQDMVEIDVENIPKDIEVLQDDFIYINSMGLLRHDTKKLSKAIMKLILKYVFPKNRKRIIDYYYLLDRVRNK